MASAERCPSPGPPLSLIVSLQTAYEVHQCGGTLVAEDWVLTSAQCLDPLPVYAKFGLRDLGADINDINGDADGVRYLNCILGRRVTRMVRHPGYNWRTLENDVALLRVASLSRVEMASAFVPLVALAGARANLTAPEYVSAGWGAEGYISGASADVAAVARFSPALQPSRIQSCNYSYDNKVRGAMRCAWAASAAEACHVDKGGGLFQRSGDTMLLAAVASWGRGCHTNGRMATIFTLTSDYRGWMCREAGVACEPPPAPPAPPPPPECTPAASRRLADCAPSKGARAKPPARAQHGEPFDATVPSSAFAASSAPQIMSRAAVMVAAVALASVGVLGCGYARSRRRQADERSSAQGGGGSPSSDVELMPEADQT